MLSSADPQGSCEASIQYMYAVGLCCENVHHVLCPPKLLPSQVGLAYEKHMVSVLYPK